MSSVASIELLSDTSIAEAARSSLSLANECACVGVTCSRPATPLDIAYTMPPPAIAPKRNADSSVMLRSGNGEGSPRRR
eukprot:7383004-Prymnesium_polylepis.1